MNGDTNGAVALIEPESRTLTAAHIRQHVNLIQEVMQAVMKKDTHYGVIPGCKQPSLYKAGSEVLLTTFRIAVSVHVEDLATEDAIRYRVRTVGTHQGTGIVVGEGIGECSSNEEKYKWRKATDAEWNATPETRRRIKYGSSYNTKQVRTEPSDVANTILKMAKKRAQIDMTLTALAASDIFTQDIEDLPDELREEAETHREEAPAKPAYSAESFKANLASWAKLVASGAKTPDRIVAMLESKATLTDEQRQTILTLKKDEAAPAPETTDAHA